MKILQSARCRLVSSALCGLLLGSGCGGKVFYGDDLGEGAADAAPMGGGGSPAEPASAIKRVTAPDETHVLVELNVPVDVAWMNMHAYLIAAPEGPLDVLQLEAGADGYSVVLETSKQPLGLRYELSAAGHQGEFLSADTAQFWVVDYANQTFQQDRVTARRLEIGEHSVIYVQDGLTMGNADEVRSYFDDIVFERATGIFTPAPDRDGNGRIVLLGIDGRDYVGGYFSTVDSLSEEEAFATGYRSNEKDMLYLNTSYGEVPAVSLILPHEFGHLLHHEVRGEDDESWTYHSEGVAESVVRAVNGFYDEPLWAYVTDNEGNLANGQSLIDWQSGNYSQYAQAYLFFAYIASQLDGIQTYVELMNIDGSPTSMDAYLQENLGKSFAETMHAMLVASWAQHPDGEFGFNGFLEWPNRPATATMSDLALAPMSGAFIPATSASVAVPATQGPNILMAGIDAAGNVDLTPPFAAGGGVIVALNGNDEVEAESEPIGLYPAAPVAPSQHMHHADHLTWLHPPPFDPRHLEPLRVWRRATRQAQHR